ncbi:MAG: hypothetical protein RIQ33_2304 [Bacteroidota bacterium]|jgi:hypothetical protein
MNLYFLVEGEETEKEVYPAWLGLLNPELQRVYSIQDISKNNYYLQAANGKDAMLGRILVATIDNINSSNFNYLVLCIDTDNIAVEDKINEVNDKINDALKKLNFKKINAEVVIVPQIKCIESWFLGNKEMYPENFENSDFEKFHQHFNVSENNPEIMIAPDWVSDTDAWFHERYLRNLFKQKKGGAFTYNKSKPGIVKDEDYLKNLILRANDGNNHIQSFKLFYDFCQEIKNKIQANQP